MTVAADFMMQPMTGDAVSMLGMEVQMKQSRFQTLVDSQGRVASSLEAKVGLHITQNTHHSIHRLCSCVIREALP
jgi:hypothetical protein